MYEINIEYIEISLLLFVTYLKVARNEIQWNLYITIFISYPSNGKIYEKEPRSNKTSLQ